MVGNRRRGLFVQMNESDVAQAALQHQLRRENDPAAVRQIESEHALVESPAGKFRLRRRRDDDCFGCCSDES